MPSIPAAIVTGALGMPLFVWGCRFIETTFHSQGLLFLWSVVGFLAPVMWSTGGMRYFVKRWREPGGVFRVFRPLVSYEEFRLFVLPAWIRIFALFLAAAISILLLKSIGVEL